MSRTDRRCTRRNLLQRSADLGERRVCERRRVRHRVFGDPELPRGLEHDLGGLDRVEIQVVE